MVTCHEAIVIQNNEYLKNHVKNHVLMCVIYTILICIDICVFVFDILNTETSFISGYGENVITIIHIGQFLHPFPYLKNIHNTMFNQFL